MPKTRMRGKKTENDGSDSLIYTNPKEDMAEVALSELDEYLQECRKVRFSLFVMF